MMKTNIRDVQIKYQNSSPEELLSAFLKHYRGRIALASSLGAEDQVLTDMVLKLEPQTRIFTLDTGRLPQETYDLICQSMQQYGIRYEIYCPQTGAVEKLEREFGPNLFYDSIDKRKQCCQVRKIEPLQRALGVLYAWITGLRREQAVTRSGISPIEWDETNRIIKLNPLADWTTEQVWHYLRHHQVPYNKLHDQGYPSIGCFPCTRAVRPGEDIRSGRWWWETPEHKECGLHYCDGKLIRRSSP